MLPTSNLAPDNSQETLRFSQHKFSGISQEALSNISGRIHLLFILKIAVWYALQGKYVKLIL